MYRPVHNIVHITTRKHIHFQSCPHAD